MDNAINTVVSILVSFWHSAVSVCRSLILASTHNNVKEEEPEPEHAAPWLDLLDPLTELVLERLPLPDYIRFAAVCTHWRSIQRNHRIRYAPRPPPMRSLPWLCDVRSSGITCYDAFEGKLYGFPGPTAASRKHVMCSAHGWVMMGDFYTDSQRTLLLVDPMSGHCIQTPPLQDDHARDPAAMSAPPTDPNCIVMSRGLHLIYLWKVREPGWTPLPCPLTPPDYFRQIVFYKDKFYCLSRDYCFLSVDPVAASTELLNMSYTHPPLIMPHGSDLFTVPLLLESDGDLLMVLLCFEGDVETTGEMRELQVFKADFSRNKWVKMGNIGGRVLFVSIACSFSMLAEDVGFSSNCIFFKDSFLGTPDLFINNQFDDWRGFNLRTGKAIKGLPIPNANLGKLDTVGCLHRSGIWFRPRLPSY